MSQRPSHFFTLAKALTPLFIVSVIGALSSCNPSSIGELTVLNTRDYQQNHGPFDSNGNYNEAWADKSPKRNYVTRQQLVHFGQKQKKANNKAKVAPTPRPSLSSETRYVSNMPKPAVQLASQRSTSAPKPAVASRPVVATKPKPKPKQVAAVKPKAKPTTVHHVKRGDTLYGLSRKYNSTIGDIQRVNKLTSSHINIGDRLVIPRK